MDSGIFSAPGFSDGVFSVGGVGFWGGLATLLTFLKFAYDFGSKLLALKDQLPFPPAPQARAKAATTAPAAISSNEWQNIINQALADIGSHASTIVASKAAMREIWQKVGDAIESLPEDAGPLK